MAIWENEFFKEITCFKRFENLERFENLSFSKKLHVLSDLRICSDLRILSFFRKLHVLSDLRICSDLRKRVFGQISMSYQTSHPVDLPELIQAGFCPSMSGYWMARSRSLPQNRWFNRYSEFSESSIKIEPRFRRSIQLIFREYRIESLIFPKHPNLLDSVLSFWK